jgi:hypothetical protein
MRLDPLYISSIESFISGWYEGNNAIFVLCLFSETK